jgi:hypothetical protein
VITDEMLAHAHGRIVGGNRVTMINGEALIPLPDKERTRAALTAALPLIRGAVVEECARLAERYVIDGKELHPDVPFDLVSTNYKSAVHSGAQYIAAAIRALSPREAGE